MGPLGEDAQRNESEGGALNKKRRKEYANRVNTRRLYMYEREFLQRQEDRMPMARLRRLAKRIWEGEGRKRPLPRIVAGEGLWYLEAWTSYCDYERGRKIILTAKHRKPLVLVHELVHAMGFEEHTHSFVRRYFYLLEKYCGYTREELIINAAWFGIRV